jgi:hypothetical protein
MLAEDAIKLAVKGLASKKKDARMLALNVEG